MVVMVAMDYLELHPISSAVPEIASTVDEWECDGVFCGIPYYLPLMKYIESVSVCTVLISNGMSYSDLVWFPMQPILVSAGSSTGKPAPCNPHINVCGDHNYWKKKFYIFYDQ